MSIINVTDAGPIEGTFSIDLSQGPGVYEFRGARGSGKTTCISSIDWLAGHKVDVTLHDGAVSGKIEGFGVVAPVGGRKRRKGECELDTIDAEKFSLTDLIDPPGKTPEVRDAHAIKALAVLSGAKADAELYYEVCGGQKAYDALGISKTTDPVLLATRVKQAFDKLARERQNTADAEADHALPLEHVPDDLDMGLSSDLEALGETRDVARDEVQRLEGQARQAKDDAERHDKANAAIEKIETEYDGPTEEEAASALELCELAWTDAHALTEDLRRQLADASEQSRLAMAKVENAREVKKAAENHAACLDSWKTQAEESLTPEPTVAELDAASAAVENATEAYKQGIRIQGVKQNQAKAKGHREAAEHAEEEAAAARNKAGEVFDVLAQSLHTTHLAVKSVDGSPRLFVDHPKRGRCAFDRVNGLSDGERVDYTLRELLPHIQSPGLLPIPQRVWQDLQPADRQQLHELAVDKSLYLFGAQVDDGELRVAYLGD